MKENQENSPDQILGGEPPEAVRTRASVMRQLMARHIEITDDPRSPEQVLDDELAKEANNILSFGEQLSGLMEQSGISTEEIVENFDVSITIVERWKLGDSEPQPSLKSDVIDFLSQRSGSI